MTNIEAKPVAVVAGSSGITGRALIELLLARGWEVIGLSRAGNSIMGERAIAIDLMDADASRRKLAGISDVTHVFYSGRYTHKAGIAEPVAENLAMLKNAVEPLLASSGHTLRHIHLVHGTKYYGSNTGPFPTPARETDSRSIAPNFYYAQEDYIASLQVGTNWKWSISRPHGLLHSQRDSPRNIVLVIAVYALICRELGLPLSFPGTSKNFSALYQCTSVDQLAEGVLWMSEDANCGNQAFNLTNGDLIRWERLWPVFARYFGMEVGPVRTLRLPIAMADKAPVWEAIRARHGLTAPPLEKLVLWDYGDFVFGPDWDIASDTSKLREFGFHGFRNTESEFIRYFKQLGEQRLLPKI